jgi:hypothetical protein
MSLFNKSKTYQTKPRFFSTVLRSKICWFFKLNF